MKSIIKRLVAIVVTCCSLALLPGCWDYEAINTRTSVIGLGIDPVQDDPEKIRVTIQFPVLSKGGGQKQGTNPGETSSFQDLSTESYSLSEAFRNLQMKMDREVDVAQLRAVVLSGHLSGEAMDSVIGQLMRLTRLNRLAFILMTPESAQKILGTQGTEDAPMDFVDKSFKIRQQGYVINRELWQYWRDLTQVGIVPVIPIITTEGTGDGRKNVLAFSGEEVYRSNKPSLELSKKETLYMNFMMGNVDNMAFDLPNGKGIMSLTDVRGKSRIRCIKTGNNIVLVAHVRLQGTLGKIVNPSPKPLPPTKITELESGASKYLTNKFTSLVEKLQQQQTDVIGFGRYYLQSHPEEETRLKEQWSEMFEHAKLDIKVDVTITSKGMLI